jgi:hypothetical protein
MVSAARLFAVGGQGLRTYIATELGDVIPSGHAHPKVLIGIVSIIVILMLYKDHIQL